MFRWLLPALLVLVVVLGSCRRDPTGGARIAEDPEGPWVSVCALRVVGPPKADQRFRGVGRHTTEAEAKRRAVVNACGAARAGAPCTGLTGGWEKAKEWCSPVTPPAGAAKKPAETQCEVTMLKPGGRSEATEQREGRTAEIACREALVAACGAVDGAEPCLESSGGWTSERATGRRRPDEY